MDDQVQPLEVCLKGSEKVIGYACPKCYLFCNPKVFACGWEDALKQAHRMAFECCNKKCATCGEPIEKNGWAICPVCRSTKETAKERALFDKAKKITIVEYDGPVWIDGYGSGSLGDGFFTDVEEFLDHCEEEETEVPPYVWPCVPIKFRISAEHVVDFTLESQGLAEFAEVDTDKIRELQSILDIWCDEQRIEGWETDYSRVILLQEDAVDVLQIPTDSSAGPDGEESGVAEATE